MVSIYGKRCIVREKKKYKKLSMSKFIYIYMIFQINISYKDCSNVVLIYF